MAEHSILVTGGAGFLGTHLLQQLCEPDCPLHPHRIKCIDLKQDQPVQSSIIDYHHGDIRDFDAIVDFFEGVDIVFHMASLVDWGTHTKEDVFSVNIEGTENVLKACREMGVKVFVYTSSLDAVYNGEKHCYMDESTPYPSRHPTAYCRSKAEAEKIVRSVEDMYLRTVCLRPADIYGEGDPFHIGSLIEMAEKGLYVRIGDGTGTCCHAYVGNVASAHIQAAQALTNGTLDRSGNVYLITDAPPSNFFSFFDTILLEAGYRLQPRDVWLPAWLMYIGGTLAELGALLVRPFVRINPKLSRFAVTYTCSDIVFSSEKAKEDFNFTPKYSQEEALRRTVEYYKKRKNKKPSTGKNT